MFVCVLLGPEAHGSHFEQAKVAIQSGAGVARQTELVRERREGELENGGKVSTV